MPVLRVLTTVLGCLVLAVALAACDGADGGGEAGAGWRVVHSSDEAGPRPGVGELVAAADDEARARALAGWLRLDRDAAGSIDFDRESLVVVAVFEDAGCPLTVRGVTLADLDAEQPPGGGLLGVELDHDVDGACRERDSGRAIAFAVDRRGADGLEDHRAEVVVGNEVAIGDEPSWLGGGPGGDLAGAHFLTPSLRHGGDGPATPQAAREASVVLASRADELDDAYGLFDIDDGPESALRDEVEAGGAALLLSAEEHPSCPLSQAWLAWGDGELVVGFDLALETPGLHHGDPAVSCPGVARPATFRLGLSPSQVDELGELAGAADAVGVRLDGAADGRFEVAGPGGLAAAGR